MRKHDWAVVLAAGDGARLPALTTDDRGQHVPKQFCSLHDQRCLFDLALARARSVVTPNRLCAVVAEKHRPWWDAAAADFAPGNLIVQPANRGTGNGVLLALMHILRRDPEARVIFLPADHHVLDEGVLAEAMRTTLRTLESRLPDIYLLGMDPDKADPELGYIKLSGRGKPGVIPGVTEFVEKPGRADAERLIAEGGLWNSFIFAARGDRLIDVFETHYPRNAMAMQAALGGDLDALRPSAALGALYERLAPLDMSRDILTAHVELLKVVRVAQCGWSDLGSPQRVCERVNLLSAGPRRTTIPAARPAYLDLAKAPACHPLLPAAARTAA